jgi:hypothetical protein
LDGPAVIWADGSQEWWINGNRHRLNEPAVVNADGSRRWYLNGSLHRIGGPAVEQLVELQLGTKTASYTARTGRL